MISNLVSYLPTTSGTSISHYINYYQIPLNQHLNMKYSRFSRTEQESGCSASHRQQVQLSWPESSGSEELPRVVAASSRNHPQQWSQTLHLHRVRRRLQHQSASSGDHPGQHHPASARQRTKRARCCERKQGTWAKTFSVWFSLERTNKQCVCEWQHWSKQQQ